MSFISMKLAGFRVVMETHYDYLRNQCKDYLADFLPEEADVFVSVTEEALDREIEQSRQTGVNASRGYAESICLYRELCSALPSHDALLVHSAVISDGDHAFAFSAPSGTGKSTHIRLWQEAFGPSVFVINGDKPILRLVDGVWWVYGTPWCGKEGWQTNVAKPLTALCFLARGQENSISRIHPLQAVPPLMHQVIFPRDPQETKASMKLLDHLVTNVPMYHMACNISVDAARMAKEAMTPKI